MEDLTATEVRERLARWFQDGERILPHLSVLLASQEGTNARIAELVRECEKLRKDADDLRAQLQAQAKEYERLRAERDEVAQAFGKLIDSVQPISQIAQKFGVRKSPFERTAPAPPAGPSSSAPPAPPAPRPSPAPPSPPEPSSPPAPRSSPAPPSSSAPPAPLAPRPSPAPTPAKPSG